MLNISTKRIAWNGTRDTTSYKRVGNFLIRVYMTDCQLLRNSPALIVTRIRNGEASTALLLYDLSDLFCCMQHTPLHFNDLETPTRYIAYDNGRASPSATHIDMISYSADPSRQSTCSLFIVVSFPLLYRR